ncbi:hypothetical protein [Salmonella sp. s55004]|uniref:hypothetical protein n=1 Tax=Salmonella sp. s55004 TaxID=3159675 RepID=UPI00397EA8D5
MLMVRKEIQEVMVKWVLQVLLELLVHQAVVVLMEIQDVMVQLVPLEPKEKRGTEEMVVLMA